MRGALLIVNAQRGVYKGTLTDEESEAAGREKLIVREHPSVCWSSLNDGSIENWRSEEAWEHRRYAIVGIFIKQASERVKCGSLRSQSLNGSCVGWPLRPLQHQYRVQRGTDGVVKSLLLGWSQHSSSGLADGTTTVGDNNVLRVL